MFSPASFAIENQLTDSLQNFLFSLITKFNYNYPSLLFLWLKFDGKDAFVLSNFVLFLHCVSVQFYLELLYELRDDRRDRPIGVSNGKIAKFYAWFHEKMI